MKRHFSRLFVLCLSVIVMEPSFVFANDGSLQINTDINQGKETKEVYYIEQETELSKLFNAETTALIAHKQELTLSEEKSLKEGIFLEDLPSNNWSTDYRELLFNPETELAVSSDYGVQLTEKKPGISWQMLALFCLGIVVMSWSLVQTRRQKGN
ncbi:type VII secretion protein EssA [Streptococcus ruminantium]|uniref:type VII secretion protein EssA n=1 Tax=Streptococcus ruminantium TaxID=1917441 RepID=UPI0012DCAE9A|nr:type VII secretion protein EssA [Streptococcus ruminantium]